MSVMTTRTRIVDQDPAYVGSWVQAQQGGFYRPGSTCIGLERDGQLVAATMYDNYNVSSIMVSIAIRGPVTKEWLYRICHYPFIQLDCKVVIATIASDNVPSQRFVRKFGFLLACAIPDADPSGALLVYTLHRANCRFLRRPHHG